MTLPAGAAPPAPSKEVTRLKREVAALKAKNARLRYEKKLLLAERALLRRERALLVQAARYAARQAATLRRAVLAVDPCPVTKPNRSQPPGSTFGAVFHGNGQLWVGLPEENIVLSEEGKAEDGGWLGTKLGWWRGVSGRLTISGRRLDSPAPPLRSDVPEGYGESGFQSSGVYFSTPGCWEVTGRVAGASLTFVTLVLRIDQ